MAEYSILMAPDEVRALLDDRKTETRRLVEPQPNVVHSIHEDASITTNLIFRRGGQRIKCPYGKPGDVLWVRENFRVSSAHDGLPMADVPPSDSVEYAVDQERVLTGRARLSVFMPRWAARIFLEVQEVRMERLQDISEEDARAEGIEWDARMFPMAYYFKEYWNRLAKPGQRWEDNPCLWVVKFKKLEGYND